MTSMMAFMWTPLLLVVTWFGLRLSARDGRPGDGEGGAATGPDARELARRASERGSG